MRFANEFEYSRYPYHHRHYRHHLWMSADSFFREEQYPFRIEKQEQKLFGWNDTFFFFFLLLFENPEGAEDKYFDRVHFAVSTWSSSVIRFAQIKKLN